MRMIANRQRVMRAKFTSGGSARLLQDYRRRGGFSLVELLVVLSCIAILGAMLLSAIPHVLARSRSSRCQSNLRQIGLAAQLWAVENNGRIVPVFDPSDATDPLSTNLWPSLLCPYMGKTLPLKSMTAVSVFVCPSTPTRFGYGYNYYYLSWPQSTSVNLSAWANIVQIARPSATVFFTDSTCPSRGAIGWRPYVRPPFLSYLQDSYVDFKHPHSTANVLWLDGHVSTESKTSDFSTNDQVWDRN